MAEAEREASNRCRRAVVLAATMACLSIPSPCYAMIELLPFFFATLGFLTLGLGVVLGALVKKPLLRLLGGDPQRLLWSTVLQVAAVEFLLLAFTTFAFLFRMSSEITAAHGHASLFLSSLFAASAMLYWVFSVIPNLYLLGKIRGDSRDSNRQFQRVGYAALFALPTPFFSFGITIIFFVSVR